MKAGYEVTRTGKEPRPRDPGIARRRRRRAGYLIVAALAVVIGAVVWAGWENRSAQAYNMDNLIRLHVVGESDAPADQALKIEVRDAILRASGDLFTAQAPGDAAEMVTANLATFREIALMTVRAAGSDSGATAEFGVFSFPERAYGPLVLPAGDYRALRVVLGEGRGANWWCILFPPLCYLDVVGGGREEAGGPGAGGVLGGRSGRPAIEAVSLSSLSAGDLRELRDIVARALADQRAPGGDGPELLVTGWPGDPEGDFLVVVADTGMDGLEVRFFFVERVRDLVSSLAGSLPWLFGDGFGDAPIGMEADRQDR